MKQVLQESAHRVPLPEYRFFAVIVIISQEARASIKIVACLVPGVLIYQYIQAPQDFQFLVTDPTGLKVLGYAAASVAAGLFVTWLMVRRIQ